MEEIRRKLTSYIPKQMQSFSYVYVNLSCLESWNYRKRNGEKALLFTQNVYGDQSICFLSIFW